MIIRYLFDEVFVFCGSEIKWSHYLCHQKPLISFYLFLNTVNDCFFTIIFKSNVNIPITVQNLNLFNIILLVLNTDNFQRTRSTTFIKITTKMFKPPSYIFSIFSIVTTKFFNFIIFIVQYFLLYIIKNVHAIKKYHLCPVFF